MQRSKEVTFPEMWFGSVKITDAVTQDRVRLNKSELACLARAAQILERVRTLMDPRECEEWTEDYRVISCAEAYVGEAHAIGGAIIPVSDPVTM